MIGKAQGPSGSPAMAAARRIFCIGISISATGGSTGQFSSSLSCLSFSIGAVGETKDSAIFEIQNVAPAVQQNKKGTMAGGQYRPNPKQRKQKDPL